MLINSFFIPNKQIMGYYKKKKVVRYSFRTIKTIIAVCVFLYVLTVTLKIIDLLVLTLSI